MLSWDESILNPFPGASAAAISSSSGLFATVGSHHQQTIHQKDSKKDFDILLFIIFL
jgi:hypothetical protein